MYGMCASRLGKERPQTIHSHAHSAHSFSAPRRSAKPLFGRQESLPVNNATSSINDY